MSGRQENWDSLSFIFRDKEITMTGVNKREVI